MAQPGDFAMSAISSMRERVTIERQVVTPDEMGGETRSWQPWRTVWAEVKPTRGGEQVLGEAIVGQQGFVVRVRFVEGLGITDRIVWRGKRLNVLAAVDNTGARNFTWITTDTGLVTD
jgi:SPP1 family predicted phage head-tail adaptor